MDAENPREEMTPAERRRRRMLRREKQRNDNVGGAAKMHTARVQWNREIGERANSSEGVRIRGRKAIRNRGNQRILLFLADRGKCQRLAASAGQATIVYTGKVCELITRIKHPAPS